MQCVRAPFRGIALKSLGSWTNCPSGCNGDDKGVGFLQGAALLKVTSGHCQLKRIDFWDALPEELYDCYDRGRAGGTQVVLARSD